MPKHELEKGFSLHRQGQLQQARLMYQAFLEEEPDHFDALHLMGLLSYELLRPQEAEGFFRKAICIKPDFHQIYLSYARPLQQLARPDEELACYDRASALKPRSISAGASCSKVCSDLKTRSRPMTRR